jgi:hypothetical protein
MKWMVGRGIQNTTLANIFFSDSGTWMVGRGIQNTTLANIFFSDSGTPARYEFKGRSIFSFLIREHRHGMNLKGVLGSFQEGSL